ncbi:MAG: PilZ domain-containing protein [Myxococcales bacterium]
MSLPPPPLDLVVEWREGRELLSNFREGRRCRLRVPVADEALQARLAPGVRLDVRSRFPQTGREVSVLCRAVGPSDLASRASWILEVEQAQERRVVLLLACARGEEPPLVPRTSDRRSLTVPVRLAFGDGLQLQCETFNVSDGGLCVISPISCAIGREVAVETTRSLWFPRRLDLRGTVASCELQPRPYAIGIRLDFRGERERGRWLKIAR